MAELTVYSTIGVRSAAEELFRNFEKASGHKLARHLGHRADAGQAHRGRRERRCFDPQPRRHGRAEQARQGPAGSDVALAGSGVAIAVKAGAPKPDISSPEALKTDVA